MSKAEDFLRSLSGDVGIGSETVTPSIPNVPATADANMKQFLSSLKQIIETWKGQRGDALDSSVTWRDLVNKQFASIDLTNGTPQQLGYLPIKPAQVSDLTPPPSPQNLEASGALANIILTWDEPNYKNHAYCEIWRSSTNNIGSAIRVGMAPGSIYADNVGGGFTYYYWARFVSTSDIVGPYNGTEGTLGATSLDPGYILDVLNGQISTSELNTSLNTRIDLIDGPVTTLGTVAARIKTETDARTAAVQTEATARAAADGSLFAQYTVKLDVNGYVSGFGLASTLNNATPYSAFVFKADQFAFGAPGLTSAYPFVIQASPATVNGVYVPAGVYIDAAYIKNGTITNAKIGSAAIDSAKIADAAIVNAKIADASITAAKIIDAQITNAKIANAAVDSAQIATAAITNAKIADANITRAKIALAAIDTARIEDAAITNAKIANLSVDDAKIVSLSATKISATSLSAISANLGTITAGSLNINNRFIINADGSTTIQSASTGARTVITDQVIKVYDASGVLRVRIGNLSA